MRKEEALMGSCSRTAAGATSSCLGRFSRALAKLRRRLRLIGLSRRRCRTYILSAGGLNYDPLSYALNFDDGGLSECEPDFSARFAAGSRRTPAPSAAS